MIADVDVSGVAALLGDPARARIAQALHDGRALPAGELARRAGISPSTASEHLSRLVEGRLLAVERTGRHRYFRLANAEVAHAIEALAAIAPPAPVRSLREASIGDALAEARTCYDHLAGKLGVQITDALLQRNALIAVADGFEPGPQLEASLAALGVRSLPTRRPLALRCIDWSERRPHVAGALGAAICTRALEARWVERLPASRAVRVTSAGRRAFASLNA
ncbi:MAG TPA: winged helix-turn-helix domain-containing protein [Gaiellaceae bacterium]|nr:winged helix-turn-helix domain-containing protein [Gaiellaceae bacterium]